MTTRQDLGRLALGCVALMVLGCADVNVTRITDRNRDCTQGFRYYLPRPFVSVKRSMPVGGDSVLVTGYVYTANDGKQYVSVSPVGGRALPKWVRERMDLSTTSMHLPLTAVIDGTGGRAPALDSGGETPGTGARVPLTEGAAGGQGDDKTEATGKATINSVKIGEGYGSFVENAGGEYFNVVYLPDFEEQYAIDFVPGLGKVGTGEGGLKLRHGWMLESISIDIDNTEIGKFIFGEISKFTGILQKFLQARVDPTSLADNEEVTKEAQEAKEARSPTIIPITLRITFVVEAQPGMYPILKPKECDRWCDWCKTFGLGTDSSNADFLMYPITPLTMVPYNVRRDLVVEAVQVGASKPAEGDG